MIQFAAEESCHGSQIHDLPAKVGKWE